MPNFPCGEHTSPFTGHLPLLSSELMLLEHPLAPSLGRKSSVSFVPSNRKYIRGFLTTHKPPIGHSSPLI